jgi:two-component system response regulator AtoC
MIRILVIEDNEEMSSLLEDFFKEDGFKIDSLNRAADVLRLLSQHQFDLILTDIQMPSLTGLDILPRVRKLQPEASIIVMTAYGNDEVHRRSIERGATSYVENPIQFGKLRTLVHEMVSSKRTEEIPTGRYHEKV